MLGRSRDRSHGAAKMASAWKGRREEKWGLSEEEEEEKKNAFPSILLFRKGRVASKEKSGTLNHTWQKNLKSWGKLAFYTLFLTDL